VNSKSTFAKVGQKSSVFVRVYQQRRIRDKPRVLSAVGKQMTSLQWAGVPISMVDSPVLSNWRFKLRLLKGITAEMKARTDAEDLVSNSGFCGYSPSQARKYRRFSTTPAARQVLWMRSARFTNKLVDTVARTMAGVE